MTTTQDKLRFARTALVAYHWETRHYPNVLPHDRAEMQEVIADLLCDLRHFCREHQLDFSDLSRSSCKNFKTELKDPDA